MPELLNAVMRWMHLTSMAMLVGGNLFARLTFGRASADLTADGREKLSEGAAAAFRPYGLAAIAGLVLSGAYVLATSPGHSARYHALLGVKLLLALHVFAVTALIVSPGPRNRSRLALGAAISGLVIIFIAGYLHRIF